MYRTNNEGLKVENLITDKEEILGWVKGINCFDEYRKVNDYQKLEWVKETIEDILDAASYDEETNTHYHNPIDREFFEIQSDEDLEWISKELIKHMLEVDKEQTNER